MSAAELIARLKPDNISKINWNSLSIKILLLILLPIFIFAAINIVTVNHNNNSFQTALFERSKLDNQNDEVMHLTMQIKDKMLTLSNTIKNMANQNQSMLLNKNNALNNSVKNYRKLVQKEISTFSNDIYNLDSALIKHHFLSNKNNQKSAANNTNLPQQTISTEVDSTLKRNTNRIKRLKRNALNLSILFKDF